MLAVLCERAWARLSLFATAELRGWMGRVPSYAVGTTLRGATRRAFIGALDNSTRVQGAGVYAGSCDERAVTEEQIAIAKETVKPRDLGEAERPLSFKIKHSPERSSR